MQRWDTCVAEFSVRRPTNPVFGILQLRSIDSIHKPIQSSFILAFRENHFRMSTTQHRKTNDAIAGTDSRRMTRVLSAKDTVIQEIDFWLSDL